MTSILRSTPHATCSGFVLASLSFLLCTSASGVAAADGPTATGSLPNVVVTGTRLDSPSTKLGSSVTVITAEDIARRGFAFVGDAVASAPGVTLNQNGPFGGVASVRIRGASSEQTLVLIDGVPINDASAPGGGFNFATMDTADVERIEILRGPQSVLWGSDAIGGVVNIITRQAARDALFSGTGFVEGGSFGTVRGGGALSVAGDGGDLRIAVTGVSSDGISKADAADGNVEDDSYESVTVNARAGFNLGERTRIDATVRHVDAQAEFDSFSFTSPTGIADGDELSDTREIAATITAKSTGVANDRLDLLAMIGYSEIDRTNFTNGIEAFSSGGQRLVFRGQATLNLGERNRVAFGAEREESDTSDDDAAINSYFGLWEFTPTDRAALTAGVRHDDHDEFGGETTVRAAVSLTPFDRLTLRQSWGQGFKAPSIFQTTFFCCGATAPNADLQPETSEGIDFGFDWRISERANLGVTFFDQDFVNLITFDFAIGGYLNIAEANTRGVEVAGAYQVNRVFGVGLTYSYIEARDDNDARLIRVPQNAGDLEFTFTPRGPFSASLAMRYNGDEDDTASVVSRWLRLDANARYRIGDRYEVFGRVENIADAQYQQVFGYGTPGISGTLGFRRNL